MISTSRSKRRTLPPWGKHAFHFSLCFLIGFLTGFSGHPTTTTTSSSSSSSSIQLISYQETLKLSPAPIQETPKPPKITIQPQPPPTPLEITPHPKDPSRLLIVITTTTRSKSKSNEGVLIGRLARTLRLVPPPLLWIVVEASSRAATTAGTLRRTGILYRHLTYDGEEDLKGGSGEHYQRNVALGHIEHHRIDGIVLFAGVDNVYDLRLFQEIRGGIQVFGAWPVALVSAKGQPEVEVEVDGPVCKSSQIVAWQGRKMISTTTANIWGFAFNSSVLWDPERWGRRPTSFPDTSQDSMRFVHEVILEDDTKVKAICSQIMLWHLQIQS